MVYSDNLLYFPLISGPDILKDLNEEDEDANQPGPSECDSTTPTKPSLNWNGKPKTIVQKAGEAVVARIVAKVITRGQRR